MNNKELELYIHIPFCRKKCLYCDFISFAGKEHLIDSYTDALCREIEQTAGDYNDRKISSVYIGGGTPSVLSCMQIEKVVNTLVKAFRIKGTEAKRKGLFLQKKVPPEVEFTIEVNPGTADPEKLKLYKKLGINRLSIGLQSTDNTALMVLGRIHDYDDFVRTYNDAREAGFDNINIDLMQAIPGQSINAWKKVLMMVGVWNPEHISAYSLIIEDGTVFKDLYDRGELKLPDEDEER
ncbi:MAG: radical SAM protein, partial [Parasporobacterium sp.]|nr:radical SAM protein [Parasporobacterium sp.]